MDGKVDFCSKWQWWWWQSLATGPLKENQHQSQTPSRVLREWKKKGDLEQSIASFNEHLLTAFWVQSFPPVRIIKKEIAIFIQQNLNVLPQNTMKTANLAFCPSYKRKGIKWVSKAELYGPPCLSCRLIYLLLRAILVREKKKVHKTW